jgi:hypothetical protein
VDGKAQKYMMGSSLVACLMCVLNCSIAGVGVIAATAAAGCAETVPEAQVDITGGSIPIEWTISSSGC